MKSSDCVFCVRKIIKNDTGSITLYTSLVDRRFIDSKIEIEPKKMTTRHLSVEV